MFYSQIAQMRRQMTAQSIPHGRNEDICRFRYAAGQQHQRRVQKRNGPCQGRPERSRNSLDCGDTRRLAAPCPGHYCRATPWRLKRATSRVD
jgi:hypothetical protein